MQFRETSKAALTCAVLILSWIAASPLAARDPQPPVPMGALAHAAAAFEKSTGGKILEIRLADTSGPPAFEAAILKGDGILYMRIASPDNHVTRIDVTKLPPWMQNYKLEAYARSAMKAQVPIEEAIDQAEKRARAPAIDAGIAKPLSGTNAVLAYFVETMSGTHRDTLAVDATTGAFIANPDSLYEPHTPVELARRLASPGPG